MAELQPAGAGPALSTVGMALGAGASSQEPSLPCLWLMCSSSLTGQVPDRGPILKRVLAGGVRPLLAHGMPLHRT